MKTHSPDELVEIADRIIAIDEISDIDRAEVDVLCMGIGRLRKELADALNKCEKLEYERDERLTPGEVALGNAGLRARIESLETALRAGGELVGRHAPEWEDSREWINWVDALLAPQGSPGESEPYREGHEYIVCDECGSHILFDAETREREFEGFEDLDGRFLGTTCDNDECGADLSPWVYNPHREPPEANPDDGDACEVCQRNGSELEDAGVPIAEGKHCPECGYSYREPPEATETPGPRLESSGCTWSIDARVTIEAAGYPARVDREIREIADTVVATESVRVRKVFERAVAARFGESALGDKARTLKTCDTLGCGKPRWHDAQIASLDQFNNEAFEAWFDLVDDCRKTGDVTPVDAVLRTCSLFPQVFTTDMLISVLRLVYNLRQHLPNWNIALISVRTELVRRGKENVDALLHGLEDGK